MKHIIPLVVVAATTISLCGCRNSEKASKAEPKAGTAQVQPQAQSGWTSYSPGVVMHGDQCISNLKQIGLAARMWGTDHQNRLPSDFVTMREALSVKALVCPGDTQRVAKAVSDWSQVSPAGISYELVSPGILEAERAKVYVKCPVHNYVLFADGLAQKYPKRVE